MSHGKPPIRCELGFQNLPRNSRRSCKGPLEYEGKFLLCESHRFLVDRIVAASRPFVYRGKSDSPLCPKPLVSRHLSALLAGWYSASPSPKSLAVGELTPGLAHGYSAHD